MGRTGLDEGGRRADQPGHPIDGREGLQDLPSVREVARRARLTSSELSPPLGPPSRRQRLLCLDEGAVDSIRGQAAFGGNLAERRALRGTR